jgi:butyryl-CoA dehydrogenase
MRNLRFLLYEVHDINALTRRPYFRDHDRETFDQVLDTAARLAKNTLRPVFREMDTQPPQYVNGRVLVHPAVREFMKECGEGGWIGASDPFDSGGQQLPVTLTAACSFMWCAANYSASVYPMLTGGAARLIETFGSEELRNLYTPAMRAGRWQGTMALTEPQAGSSLSDVLTSATPTDDGHYKIKGQKIFISAGDHDAADNTVHLMLARIKGAPPGVKGISLFVVPRLRPENGALVENDVNTAGIFHKLGYRGCPITHLSMGERDDCRGRLVGTPHSGLQHMFQMMNEARIEVGVGATGIASAAYYTSLSYAQERPQGRRVTEKDPTRPPVLIFEHADVKRMLLFQRAVVEGALSLLLQCGVYADLEKTSDSHEKARWSLLLGLLTPAAKSYPSETGLESVSKGLQILGGYGYCDEFPLEQHYRDMRIHAIHEGTTGIQALDLLGRKVIIHEGAALKLFREEVTVAIQTASGVEELRPYADRLMRGITLLGEVTDHLVRIRRKEDIEASLADAVLYLEMFSLIAIAWQWLIQGLAIVRGGELNPSPADAAFYSGKLRTMRFFFHYELPKIEGLAKRLAESDRLTPDANAGDFED